MPAFLRHFDFVSIGTNDLIQYTLAIDRADEAVAHLYNPWHPAVLQLVAQTIEKARAAGKGVSVCGEMAGDPAFSELLVAMGLRSFSMHPSQIVAVKERLLATDARCWSAWLPRILSADDPERECAIAASAMAADRLELARRRRGGGARRGLVVSEALGGAQRGRASADPAQACALAGDEARGLTAPSKTCQNRGLR